MMIAIYFILNDRNKIIFARLDGTLNQQQREKVISQFTEEKDILVIHLDANIL